MKLAAKLFILTSCILVLLSSNLQALAEKDLLESLEKVESGDLGCIDILNLISSNYVNQNPRSEKFNKMVADYISFGRVETEDKKFMPTPGDDGYFLREDPPITAEEQRALIKVFYAAAVRGAKLTELFSKNLSAKMPDYVQEHIECASVLAKVAELISEGGFYIYTKKAVQDAIKALKYTDFDAQEFVDIIEATDKDMFSELDAYKYKLRTSIERKSGIDTISEDFKIDITDIFDKAAKLVSDNNKLNILRDVNSYLNRQNQYVSFIKEFTESLANFKNIINTKASESDIVEGIISVHKAFIAEKATKSSFINGFITDLRTRYIDILETERTIEGYNINYLLSRLDDLHNAVNIYPAYQIYKTDLKKMLNNSIINITLKTDNRYTNDDLEKIFDNTYNEKSLVKDLEQIIKIVSSRILERKVLNVTYLDEKQLEKLENKYDIVTDLAKLFGIHLRTRMSEQDRLLYHENTFKYFEENQNELPLAVATNVEIFLDKIYGKLIKSDEKVTVNDNDFKFVMEKLKRISQLMAFSENYIKLGSTEKQMDQISYALMRIQSIALKPMKKNHQKKYTELKNKIIQAKKYYEVKMKSGSKTNELGQFDKLLDYITSYFYYGLYRDSIGEYDPLYQDASQTGRAYREPRFYYYGYLYERMKKYKSIVYQAYESLNSYQEKIEHLIAEITALEKCGGSIDDFRVYFTATIESAPGGKYNDPEFLKKINLELLNNSEFIIKSAYEELIKNVEAGKNEDKKDSPLYKKLPLLDNKHILGLSFTTAEFSQIKENLLTILYLFGYSLEELESGIFEKVYNHFTGQKKMSNAEYKKIIRLPWYKQLVKYHTDRIYDKDAKTIDSILVQSKQYLDEFAK